jgi:predicted dehydrogenase
MDDPRIGIIGAGSLSSRRIYPYIGQAGGQIVGVCDLVRGNAERNARRFGGRPYSDYREMLEIEHPDGVIVCIGPEQHAELALALIARGIPVYTEKPPAPTAADALRVARSARDANVLCTTAFKKRYATAYTRAKEWLGSFDAARHLSLSIDYASGPYGNTSPRDSFLLDFGIHCIDLTAYLFGDVSRVMAFSKAGHGYAVSLAFANGAVGSLSMSDGRSFTMPTEEVELTVEGGNAMTIHNSSCYRIVEKQRAVEWREPPTFTSAGDSGNDTGHLAEIAEFLVAIREHRTTRSSIAEAYKSMVLYEAIRASAESASPVDVRYEPV